jgi:hypothetical protein
MNARMLCVFAVLSWLAAGGGIAAGSASLSVRLHEPFVVGARSFEGGLLSLRSIRSYNPTSALGELWVGDECLGLVVARRDPAEPRGSAVDRVLFRRGSEGRLVLAGYAVADLDAGSTYWIETNVRLN